MEPREVDLDPRQVAMEIDTGQRPDGSLVITRRLFINKAILAGTAVGVASVGWFPVEIDLGADILKELTIKKHFIPGEHDWYLDMGAKWEKMFGKTPWTFDHKGMRFIGLNTVGFAPDYWSAKKMSPKERMGHMATLDGSVAGPWAGVGDAQQKWLQQTVLGWGCPVWATTIRRSTSSSPC